MLKGTKFYRILSIFIFFIFYFYLFLDFGRGGILFWTLGFEQEEQFSACESFFLGAFEQF